VTLASGGVRVLGVTFMVGAKWSLELELESGFEGSVPLNGLRR